MTYHGNLQGVAKYMQDRAPDLDDPTLMALGELLSLIADVYESNMDEYGDLVRAGYAVSVAWLLNQGRS